MTALTPAEIAALRVLLARAQAAGWERLFSRYGSLTEHVWWTPDLYRVWIYNGDLVVSGESDGRTWDVPVRSVAQVTAVLELAGALPAAGPEYIQQHIRARGTSLTDQPCGRCLGQIAEGADCVIVGPIPATICAHCTRLIDEGMAWIVVQGGEPQ